MGRRGATIDQLLGLLRCGALKSNAAAQSSSLATVLTWRR
jgi:hypothetical protein